MSVTERPRGILLPLAGQPVPPVRQYSFTDWQVNNPTAPPPGDRMDAEYDRTNNAYSQILDWVGTSLNSDGTLKTGSVGEAQLEPDLLAGMVDDATALAADYALVTQAWAEHMPDTIPPNILAVMGITGDHWSARWWANRAAQQGGSAVVSLTPPDDPWPGLLWFDASNPQLFVWYDDGTSAQWVIATANTGGLATDAPADGLTYGRSDGAWTPVLPLSGGEITGDLQVDGSLRVGATVDAGFKLDVNGSSRFTNDLNANGWIINGTNTAAGALIMNGPANQTRQILWQTGGISRVRLGLSTAAEAGGNVGGDWQITTFADAGGVLGNPALRLFRGTGNLTIGGTVDGGFKLDVVGTARISGLVTANAGATIAGGALTVGTNTTAQVLQINGPAGAPRSMNFQTAGLARWGFTTTGTAESGSNAGSDLHIVGYSDAGTAITPNPVMKFSRATGNIILGGAVDAGFRLDVVGTARVSGLVTLTGGATVAGASRFTVTASNPLLISANAATPTPSASLMLQLVASDGGSPQLQMDSAASNGQFNFRRSNGTIAVPTGTAANNVLGSFAFMGHDTSAYTTARASLTVSADGVAWTPTSTPTRITASVTPAGATAQVEAWRVSSAGNLLLGGTVDAGFRLDVTGSARLNGNVGFQGTAPIAKPTVTGAKAGNTALASLCAALVSYGLIADTSSA